MPSSSYNKKTSITIDLDGKMLWFLVQAVLVILKLGGVLNISWWLIWLPTLVPVGAVVAIFLVMFICALASPKFRAFVHKALEEAEEKKAEIETNGVDDEDNNKR